MDTLNATLVGTLGEALDDLHLSWMLIVHDDTTQGVVMWGLSGALEKRLRALHFLKSSSPPRPRGEDFSDWMLPPKGSTLDRDAFIETIDGVYVHALDVDARGNINDALAHVTACREQAMQRLGNTESTDFLPVIVVRGDQRPLRRMSMFIDEALVDLVKERLLMHVESRLLRKTVAGLPDASTSLRSRSRL